MWERIYASIALKGLYIDTNIMYIFAYYTNFGYFYAFENVCSLLIIKILKKNVYNIIKLKATYNVAVVNYIKQFGKYQHK